MTGHDLDAAVAEYVMGWKLRGPHPTLGSDVWATGKSDTLLPRFSTDIAAAWQVVEKMVALQEANVYKSDGFHSWDGPIFKDSAHYMTNEGYPLGTTCWFVLIQWNGQRKHICADTAPEAICKAALCAFGKELP